MHPKIKKPFSYINGYLVWGQDRKKISTPTILILVLSCKTPPFDLFMRTQMETWDSIPVAGIRTLYYVGDAKKTQLKGDVLEIAQPDSYSEMHWKFKEALMFVNSMNWDFIFRTNASAYINKQSLKQFAAMLPKRECYCGVSGLTSHSDFQHVNGGGIFLSRDVATILEKRLEFKHTSLVEDGEIGKIMHQAKIEVTPGGWRGMASEGYHPGCYHYRCRSPNLKRGPFEVTAMRKLFEYCKK
jgi:hypothetical protein